MQRHNYHQQSQRDHQRDRNNKNLALVFIAMACLVVVYLLEGDEEPTQPEVKVGEIRVPAQKANKLVDNHLKNTDAKIQIDQQARYVESFKMPGIGERLQIPPPDGRRYFVESPDNPFEDEVARDINNEEKYFNMRSPSAIIQNKVKEQQAAEEQYDKYVKEYIAEFLANARRHGYDVKLNQNMEVISVVPIQKPTKLNDLGTGNGAIR